MNRTTLGIVSLMLIVAAAAHAGSVDNPMYKEWAQWREGAFATVKTEVKVDGAVQVVTTQTQKLTKLTAEKAAVEYTSVTEVAGQVVTAPPMVLDVIAKLPKIEVKDTAAANEPKETVKYKETQGKESLTIKGKKLDCEWIQIEMDGVFSKTWNCDQVPGRLVKMESRAGGATTTMLLTDWKAEKK